MDNTSFEPIILSKSLTQTEKMICWFIKTTDRQDLTNKEIAEKIGRDPLMVSRAIKSLAEKEILLIKIKVTRNGTEREIQGNPNFFK